MKFKKIDVLISGNLTAQQIKAKVLPQLNLMEEWTQQDANTLHYIANIHDTFNRKYWICVDTKTKDTLGMSDELVEISSMDYAFVNDNFQKKAEFDTYKTNNDTRIRELERTVELNEEDIERKNRDVNVLVAALTEEVRENKELYDNKMNELDQFVQQTNTSIENINNILPTKALLNGSNEQIFFVANATEDLHAVNKSQLDAAIQENTNSVNEFKSEYETHIQQVDENIARLFDTFDNLEGVVDTKASQTDLDAANERININIQNIASKANITDVFSKQDFMDNVYGVPFQDPNSESSLIVLNSYDDVETYYNKIFKGNKVQFINFDKSLGSRIITISGDINLDTFEKFNKFQNILFYPAVPNQVVVTKNPDLTPNPKIIFGDYASELRGNNEIIFQDIDMTLISGSSNNSIAFSNCNIVNCNFDIHSSSRYRSFILGSCGFVNCSFTVNYSGTNNPAYISIFDPTHHESFFGRASTIAFSSGLMINRGVLPADTPIFITDATCYSKLAFANLRADNTNLDFTKIVSPVNHTNWAAALSKIKFNSILSNGLHLVGAGSLFPTGEVNQTMTVNIS